jgi:hypothetical protein
MLQREAAVICRVGKMVKERAWWICCLMLLPVDAEGVKCSAVCFAARSKMPDPEKERRCLCRRMRGRVLTKVLEEPLLRQRRRRR